MEATSIRKGQHDYRQHGFFTGARCDKAKFIKQLKQHGSVGLTKRWVSDSKSEKENNEYL